MTDTHTATDGDLDVFALASRLRDGHVADNVEILNHLDAEDAARSELMRGRDRNTRAVIENLLTYPENTAGAMMTTEFVSVPANWTVEQPLQHLRRVERPRETVSAIYVLA